MLDVSLTSDAGPSVDLDTEGVSPRSAVRLLGGVQAFDDLPATYQTLPSGSVEGDFLNGARGAGREVFLPLRLWGASTEALAAVSDGLRAATSRHRGLTTVRVETERGVRSIKGLATREPTPWGSGTYEPSGGGWRQVVGLTVRCPDPFWRGDPVELVWQPPAAPSPFLESLLPVVLASSQVIGSAQLAEHGGDVPGVGVWSLAGPWTRARLSDDVTGRSMVLEPPAPVALGDVVTVHTDVRSGVRVVAPDGSSAWPWLRPPFDVWSPEPHARVRVQMEGVGEGSYARLELTPRFEAAL